MIRTLFSVGKEYSELKFFLQVSDDVIQVLDKLDEDDDVSIFARDTKYLIGEFLDPLSF